MIVDVKKYLIIGAQEELDQFFEKAQQQGIIEFIPPAGKRAHEVPIEIHHLLDAIRVLRKLPVKKSYLGGGDLPYADEIAHRILSLRADVIRLMEEKRMLEVESVRVAPFGEFDMADIDFLEKETSRKIQFFCMKTAKTHQANFGNEVLYVGTDYDLDYFVTINREERSYPDMIEMRIDRPVNELQAQLGFVKDSLYQLEAELKGYAGHLDFLQEALIERLNDFHLLMAKKQVSHPLGTSLFAVEAWVPKNKTVILYSLLDAMAVHCEPILIEEQDQIPTYMENKGMAKIGEDLVKIYDIPASTDKDPSSWVLWSFVLFFAIIVADGGYGLIFLTLSLFLKFKFPALRGQQRRFLKLAITLSIACVVWGVLTTSFFGLLVPPKSWIGKVSIMEHLAKKKIEYHFSHRDDVYQTWVAEYPVLAQVETPQAFIDGGVTIEDGRTKYEIYNKFEGDILLELSLVIGIIHLSLSFIRYFFRNWAGIGWVIFMVGGYFYFPAMLNATTMAHFLGVIDKETAARLGIQLVYTGIGLALFLALVQKRLKGLGEISNLVQVFADVLSYLRLYALALAGSIMAETFNMLGSAVGLFFGVLVIMMGHGVNILLGIVAGVIHGLRLNFIEWYHYCFDGGGRLFRPLMRLKHKGDEYGL